MEKIRIASLWVFGTVVLIFWGFTVYSCNTEAYNFLSDGMYTKHDIMWILSALCVDSLTLALIAFWDE